MKKTILLSIFTALFLTSMGANAEPDRDRDDHKKHKEAPEIDASNATLGLGLLAGAIGLIAERRRK